MRVAGRTAVSAPQSMVRLRADDLVRGGKCHDGDDPVLTLDRDDDQELSLRLDLSLNGHLLAGYAGGILDKDLNLVDLRG